MAYHYFVEIKLDTTDNWPLIGDERKYLDAIDKYCALGIGHEKRGTSSLEFNSKKMIERKNLQKELGDLEIIAFNESEILITKDGIAEMTTRQIKLEAFT